MVAPLLVGGAKVGKAVSRAGGTRRGIRNKKNTAQKTPRVNRTEVLNDSFSAPTTNFFVTQTTAETFGKALSYAKVIRIMPILLTMTMGWYLGGQLLLFFSGLVFVLGSVVFIPLDTILSLLNLNYGTAFMQGIGFFLNTINWGMSWLLTGSMWFILAATGIRSLSGSHAATKIIFFILALIGYAASFFQFLPWVLPWLWIVSRYPD